MALIINDLAQDLYASLAKTTDRDGKTTYSNDYTKAYAAGVVNMIKATILTGTANGTTSPAVGQSSDGQGPFISNVGIMTSTIVGQFTTSDPSKVSAENNAVANYFTSNLKIEFSMGKITGSIGGDPPTFTGTGANGVVTSIDGSALASAVASALGFVGPDMQPFYTALCNYILSNAIAQYGNVTGPVAGPIWSGTANIGSII